MKEKSSFNEALPIEILGKIFSHVPGDDSKRLLMSVCKSWYSAAVYNYGSFAKVFVSKNKLAKLNRDFKKFPLFGSRVVCITIKKKKAKRFNCAFVSSGSQLTAILERCPNLIQLNLSRLSLLDADSFIISIALLNDKIYLKKLQNLLMPSRAYSHSNDRVNTRIHVSILMKFRYTLTHLNITDDGFGTYLINIDRLMNFVNYFPSLRVLNISILFSNIIPVDIYLPDLFIRETMFLEEVNLHSSENEFGIFDNSVISTRKVNLDTCDPTPNSTLKILVLKTLNNINIGNLQFIMMKFKNLKILEIEADSVTADHLEANTRSLQNIIRQFHQYCIGIDVVSIRFYFEHDTTRYKVDTCHNKCLK